MSAIAGSRDNNIAKTFPAELDQLYNMLRFVKENAFAFGVNSDDAIKVELAMEEALVNIITYGYPEDQKGTIEILCAPVKKTGMQILIKDHGIPYNPLANANKLLTNTPSGGQILGGYGIYFILKIMDEVNYHRERDCNCLTLIKYTT
ncbi:MULTISPECIES: ATP-binding protein [Parachlamydia]|jgi:anti-sigma regulatory factor (Ser/Thr protein kinase)|uniref:Histidine kinase/HSP90-like ATPase domain-containing protein n=2 Tax=Parachlamydia acanthamoebae TaxID=83552 RepID=F8L1N1_PARAV|nr:ATP-binding protein [Parachlamydia acanthamoebae]EFB40476.1 hypothetical protein pah_c200o021 [Parachlamydia acanthamoebae str. Hall's coccus]CCB87179.1 putative uncharacterized protein [Parachlamydia acanthamoebae UV-7]